MPAMKKLIKWLFGLVFVAVALLVLAIVCRDAILKEVVERQIRAETGMDARIGGFHLGLREPVVRFENFKIYNPDEFGGAPLVNIRELHAEYDRTALLSQKLHLTLVRFNLAEVNVVEGKSGKTNVEVLQEKQKQKASSARAKKGKAQIEFSGIDTLKVTLGYVKFSSMKDPAKGQVMAMDVKDYELKNVRSATDLSGLVLAIVLKNGVNFLGTGLSTLTGPAAGASKGAEATVRQGTGNAPQGNAAPSKKKQ
jgi:uncharacterized protein involved in outer membrane biogenesis